MIYTGASSLLFTLIVPTVALLTRELHHADRADEKTLAIGLTVLFASIALIFLARLARSLTDGESLGWESHWGGLGGGVGGWRISRPVAYLLCLISFGALTATAMSQYPREHPKSASLNEANTQTERTAARQTPPDKFVKEGATAGQADAKDAVSASEPTGKQKREEMTPTSPGSSVD